MIQSTPMVLANGPVKMANGTSESSAWLVRRSLAAVGGWPSESTSSLAPMAVMFSGAYQGQLNALADTADGAAALLSPA